MWTTFWWAARRAHVICIAGNYISQVPLPTGFQVGLANGWYWWKTGGQDEPEYFSSFLLPMRLPALSALVCLLVYAVSGPVGQAHPLGSQLLWSSPCHSSNSQPMASGSGSGNMTSSLGAYSPRGGGGFLLLLISGLPHHPSLGFLALSLPM